MNNYISKPVWANQYYYKFEIYENGAWKNFKLFDLPFFTAQALDESLDTGKIVKSMTDNPEPYKPFTPIKMMFFINTVNSKLNEDERPKPVIDYTLQEPIYMLISSDTVKKKGIYYDHFIELVEITKLVERNICDTITFTNALKLNPAIIGAVPQDIVMPVEKPPIFLVLVDKGYKPLSKMMLGGVLHISSLNKLLYTEHGWFDKTSYIEIVYNDGEKQKLQYDTEHFVEIMKTGIITVVYHCVIRINLQTVLHYSLEAFFSTTVYDGTLSKPTYSITDVLNRILYAGVTRRDGLEEQRFRLDPKIAERYKNVPAPEFHITKSNLYEALLQVGSHIHAVPRLLWNKETDKPDTITFDLLGGSDEYTLPSYCILHDSLSGIDDESYCDSMDSTIENLVMTTDIGQGSIVEPDVNAYKTLRTDIGNWRISNDTAVFQTAFPIYRVLEFEMGYINDGQFVGNITPFVYEAAEYATLTSYGGNFPYAKKFALTYSQGDNKITSFSYKPNSVEPALTDPTITNILKNLGFNFNIPYKNLAFRVKYIPIATGRIKQFKTKKGFPQNNTLIFQQSSNTTETSFYGEHLKGVLARIGNTTYKETYYFRYLTDMPKIGQLFKGRYIVGIETGFSMLGPTATLTMTKNYNKISSYLGLNSNYRLFDVSEKQSIDRHMNYSELCEIGDDIVISGEATITPLGVEVFAKTFSQEQGHHSASVALVQGLDKSKNTIGEMTLQASTSVAVGNSLAFSWGYADNFGAGYKSVFQDGNNNNQTLVSYVDVYGEMAYLDMRIGANTKTTDYNDQVSTDGWCNSLPAVPQNQSGAIYFDTGNKPLIVLKDSRERILVTSQLHFISNRDSICIGQALGKNNLLVSQADVKKAAKLVFLPYTLNELNNIVDMSGAEIVKENGWEIVSTNSIGKKITLNSVINTTGKPWKSWALVDTLSNLYYIGENINLATDDETKQITFTFKSNKEV